MAIPHASPGQPIDIRPLGDSMQSARTVALIKTDELELMRLVLPAGKSVPPHKVPGAITIQCLEGVISVTAAEQPQELRAGELMLVSGGVLHSLLGITDATVLVTIVLP